MESSRHGATLCAATSTRTKEEHIGEGRRGSHSDEVGNTVVFLGEMT